ncbi:hypothetical protein EPO04_04175 [Patescibacteria group bacterium]|nr:MAG: hypothetical protein EPO04_04175 [Patescibacteria group bacterium]
MSFRELAMLHLEVSDIVEEIRQAIPTGVKQLSSGGFHSHQNQVVALKTGHDPTQNSSYYALDGSKQSTQKLLRAFGELEKLLPPIPFSLTERERLNAELREVYQIEYMFYGEIAVFQS